MTTTYHPDLMNWARNMEKAEALKAADASQRSQMEAKATSLQRDLQQQAKAARMAGA